MSAPTQRQALAFVAGRWPQAVDVRSRALKLAEEAGEVIGAVVKIGEGRRTLDDLATELAQLNLCAMALAEAAGIDLEAATATEYARALAPRAPTDADLDALAGALVPRLNALADLDPTNPEHPERPAPTNGGRLQCQRCTKPLSGHTIRGGCP